MTIQVQPADTDTDTVAQMGVMQLSWVQIPEVSDFSVVPLHSFIYATLVNGWKVQFRQGRG